MSTEAGRTTALRVLLALAAVVALASPLMARSGPADFTSSTATPATPTVYALDTIEFTVDVVNKGEPPFNWVEVDVSIPAGAMFAGASAGAQFDPAERKIHWQAAMPEERRRHSFTLLAMADTEGNTLSPGVTIRHGATGHWLWPKAEVDTRPAVTVFRIGRYGATRAGAVVLGFLAILFGTMIVAWLLVAFLSRGDAPRMPLSRVPMLVSGIWVSGLCLGFLLYFGWLASEDRRMKTEWKETQCTVLDSLATYSESSSSSGSPSSATRKRTGTWKPMFAVKYATSAGLTYSAGYRSPSMLSVGGGASATDDALRSATTGSVRPCWYDPRDVKSVVLNREAGGAYVFALIPLLVLFLGLGMVRHGIRRLGR
jgi:hypothetical protein